MSTLGSQAHVMTQPSVDFLCDHTSPTKNYNLKKINKKERKTLIPHTWVQIPMSFSYIQNVTLCG